MEALLRSLSDCYQSVALGLLVGTLQLAPAEEFQLNHRRFRAVRKVRFASLFFAQIVRSAPGTRGMRRTHRRRRRRGEIPAASRCAQLGEGGYAFVFLVKECPAPSSRWWRTRSTRSKR